ncbi:MAG: hypothetical protein ACKO7X_03320, partial [Bacteroidota bacterium]
MISFFRTALLQMTTILGLLALVGLPLSAVATTNGHGEIRSLVEVEGHSNCATLKGARAGIEMRNRMSLSASAMNRGGDTYDIHHYHFNLALTNTSTAIAGDVMFRSTVTSPV